MGPSTKTSQKFFACVEVRACLRSFSLAARGRRGHFEINKLNEPRGSRRVHGMNAALALAPHLHAFPWALSGTECRLETHHDRRTRVKRRVAVFSRVSPAHFCEWKVRRWPPSRRVCSGWFFFFQLWPVTVSFFLTFLFCTRSDGRVR